jgi:hypothetical protein
MSEGLTGVKGGDEVASIADVTGVFDLASSDDQRRVRDIADSMLGAGTPSRSFRTIGADPGAALDLRVATKLALSKRAVEGLDWKGSLGVVFAMWGEGRRLRPRSADNPTGEDALCVKLDQLAWLLGGSDIDYRVYPVDDGDPDDSAEIARQRARSHPEGERVHVLRLADALPAASGPLVDLDSVDDSRKGGAIVYGASVALADGCDAVVMTDADNSVNLGQTGLLLDPFLNGADVVVGDRKHPEAVLVKAEARWGPGIVVLRHMQRMVGRALFSRGLRDTQAAFKLYNRASLESILDAPSTYGFAFDSDWLYSAIAADRSIERVPFAFIDSFEESASITQGPMTTWESLLRGLVDAARARGVDHDEDMARVVDDHASATELEFVVQSVPPQLRDATDQQLGSRDVMSPSDLRDWLEDLSGI